MAKAFNIKKTELYKNVAELVSCDMWPFESISAKEFMHASERLLKFAHYVGEREVDGQQYSAEAYMDIATESTIEMLRCVQKMTMDASSQEMESMLKWNQNKEYDMTFLEAKQFVEYAKNEMYELNNSICDHLLLDLSLVGIPARYIDMEIERTYLIDRESTFAVNATHNHYNAVKTAYDEIDNLIKYGLPSERFAGQVKDIVLETDAHKRHNKTIVDKILSSEADLEVVMLYILPEIDLRIQEYCARAIVEETNEKEQKDLAPNEMQQSNPRYFRNTLQLYIDARESITNAILQMHEKEKALESCYKIGIERDPNTGTYSLTASWTDGTRTLNKTQKQLTSNVTLDSTTTKKSNYKTKSITLKIGQSSHRLYEEIKKSGACKFGYENNQELSNKDTTLSNLLSIQTMRKEAMLKRQTQVTGKHSFLGKVDFDVAKAENKVVVVKKQENQEAEEHTLLKISANIASASANFDATRVVPKIKASAHSGEIKAEALGGVFSASASGPSINYSSSTDLFGKVKEIAVDQLLEEKTIEESSEQIKQTATSAVKKVFTVAKSSPRVKATVAVDGIALMEASIDESGIKTENKFDKMRERFQEGTELITNPVSSKDSFVQQNAMLAVDVEMLDVKDKMRQLKDGITKCETKTQKHEIAEMDR